MSDAFLRHSAADLVRDPNFTRFLRAFQEGTQPTVPQQFVEARFRASDGTVRDVLEEIFATYPQSVDVATRLAEIRSAGALDALETEVAPVLGPLDSWYAFMDGRVQANPA
jgi:hypothetical protein